VRRTICSTVVGGLLTVATWAGSSSGVGQAASADPSGRAGTATAPRVIPAAIAAAPGTTTAPSTSSVPTAPSVPAAPFDAASVGELRPGQSGPPVQSLQQRLSDLGYWLGGTDGQYGDLTQQAVLAFQKAEGLGRDGIAGPETQGRLATAQRPAGRSTSGNLIEIDLSRQLLLVIENGQVRWAFNTSTGKASTPTPAGQYSVQRQIDGYRHSEYGVLYRPKYFVGGVAIHGYDSVPAYPASHACTRVSNAAMDLLWSSGVAEVGAPVWVY
jgi:peptidoglycan hydrolase-like protein with peptidoglycan-binding domain